MPGVVGGIVDSIDAELLNVYQDLEPQFTSAIVLGQAIGLAGAMCYVAYRVWRHLSENSPIAVFPLLRPIALGVLLICYGPTIKIIKAMYDAVDSGSKSELVSVYERIDDVSDKIEQETWMQQYRRYSGVAWSGGRITKYDVDTAIASNGSLLDLGAIGTGFLENFKTALRDIVLLIFEVIFAVARVLLKVAAVFFLIVLFILGPLVIGFSCFDWFSGSLASYTARIVQIMLWGVVSNIMSMMLSTVQLHLLERTLLELRGSTTSATTGYTSNDYSMMIFNGIGILLFFMIPKICEWIIQSVTGTQSNPIMGAPGAVASAVGGAAGAVAGSAMSASMHAHYNSSSQSSQTSASPTSSPQAALPPPTV